MKDEVQNNYNQLKQEMRKFLKKNHIEENNIFINNQLSSILQTLREMNNQEFDIHLQNKIHNVYQKVLPYMIGYWMLTDNGEDVQNSLPNQD